MGINLLMDLMMLEGMEVMVIVGMEMGLVRLINGIFFVLKLKLGMGWGVFGIPLDRIGKVEFLHSLWTLCFGRLYSLWYIGHGTGYESKRENVFI